MRSFVPPEERIISGRRHRKTVRRIQTDHYLELRLLAKAALLAKEAGGAINLERFIPFVVLHEYESLSFSDCAAFARGIGRVELEPHFTQIRQDFATPEDINDFPDTCPSKRVKNLVPGYEKPLLGTLAALEIGLARIRAACPHFGDWLRRLLSVANL